MYTSLKPLPIVFLRGLGAPYDMYTIPRVSIVVPFFG